MIPRLVRAVVAAVAAALCLIVFTAGPALAHTELKTSAPANGATVATAPTTVSLTFGEAVTLPANPITVTGPDNATWTVGKATVTDATVTAPVTATGPAGAYTMNWQVISDDGDTIKGTVKFTLSTPATPTTTAAAPATSAAVTPVAAPAAAPAPAAESSGGVPGWVWVLVGVIVVAAVGGIVARSRRT